MKCATDGKKGGKNLGSAHTTAEFPEAAIIAIIEEAIGPRHLPLFSNPWDVLEALETGALATVPSRRQDRQIRPFRPAAAAAMDDRRSFFTHHDHRPAVVRFAVVAPEFREMSLVSPRIAGVPDSSQR